MIDKAPGGDVYIDFYDRDSYAFYGWGDVYDYLWEVVDDRVGDHGWDGRGS